MAEEKNPHAVALGKLGGAKGGKARAAKLTAKERTEAAREAVNARWDQWRRTIAVRPGDLYAAWSSIRLELVASGPAAGTWAASASRGTTGTGVGPCFDADPRAALGELLDKASKLSKGNRREIEALFESELAKREH